MYRIRFHGRGGQGVKTAAQILGQAFFLEGYRVQDAPRYGAERRGAPVFAYVRAARGRIDERGVIASPGLVVVIDDTLVGVPGAGVLQGLTAGCTLLLRTAEKQDAWEARLRLPGRLIVLAAGEPPAEDAAPAGPACAGAAARLAGVIGRESLDRAVRTECAALGTAPLARSLAAACAGFDAMAGKPPIAEGAPANARTWWAPGWVVLSAESAPRAAPAVRAAATSELVETGLWRTLRPVLDAEHCNRCSWICSTLCPDGAIRVAPDRTPSIDLDHCKGCLVCAEVCPPHAIRIVPEALAREEERAA